jgi:hypothetical protein
MQKAAASVVENFLDDILGEDLGFTNELII